VEADPWQSCESFDWDEYNAIKLWDRHKVTPAEAEEVFFQQPIIVRGDIRHPKREKRFYLLGQTNAGRLLFAALTVRPRSIRIISARDMSRRETEVHRRYEENWKEDEPGGHA
jgi:uncharacterized DUF497 family protein